MKTTTTSAAALPSQSALTSAVAGAWETVGQSFDQFCLLAGFSALGEMMAADVTVLAGEAHAGDTDRPGYRWGRTCGRLGFHGGKVELERPRVRSKVTWEGICPARLAGGGCQSRMVGRMGAESDADERGHAQVRAGRAPGEAGVPSEAGSGLSKWLSVRIVCMGVRWRLRGKPGVRRSPVQAAGTIAGSCRDIWSRRLGSAARNPSTGCVGC